MRVTNKLATRMFKLGLTAKKKHKAPSLTEVEFKEYMNMVNILNTIGRDENEICGYEISKYEIPTKMSDLVLPIELSWSGDKDGNNILSPKYHTYNPASAGFVDTNKFMKLMNSMDITLSEEEPFAEVLKVSKPKFQELDGFRLWLTPDEFYTLGSLILATFRASTDENAFESVDTYKDFESIENYKDRITTSDTLVRMVSTDFCPVDVTFDLYRRNKYTYDKEETFIDWFKAVCDTIITGK